MRFIVPPSPAVMPYKSSKDFTDTEIIRDITEKNGEILNLTYPKDPLVDMRRLITMYLGNITFDEKKERNEIEHNWKCGMFCIKLNFIREANESRILLQTLSRN